MKYKEIEGMASSELTKKLRELRSDLFELKMKNSMGQQVTNPMMIRTIRRDIARVLTALNKQRAAAGRSQ